MTQERLRSHNWKVAARTVPCLNPQCVYLCLSFLLSWDNRGSNMTEKGQKGDETSKHLKIDKNNLLCLLTRNQTQNQLLATHIGALFPKPICASASSLMQLLSTFPQTLKLGLSVLSTFWWGRPIPAWYFREQPFMLDTQTQVGSSQVVFTRYLMFIRTVQSGAWD